MMHFRCLSGHCVPLWLETAEHFFRWSIIMAGRKRDSSESYWILWGSNSGQNIWKKHRRACGRRSTTFEKFIITCVDFLNFLNLRWIWPEHLMLIFECFYFCYVFMISTSVAYSIVALCAIAWLFGYWRCHYVASNLKVL